MTVILRQSDGRGSCALEVRRTPGDRERAEGVRDGSGGAVGG